jgi:colanic acid biosynthesis glycosyl transferase WcaI
MTGTTVRTLLIISQVYPPDPAAVGQHVADAAQEMVRRGWQVIVYTSARGYDDPSKRYAAREQRNGVDVRRLPLSSFGKKSIAIRLLAQGLFMLQATAIGLWTRNVSLVLVSTSPPFAGLGGSIISFIRRVPLVWWVMDLNPDQMIAAGKIGPRAFPARVFDWINRLTMRRARDIVVLDRFMRDRVLAKMPVAEKVQVIPPWANEHQPAYSSPKPNAFRSEHGLEDAFIVMYSGNHAIQHPLDTLLDAAAQMENETRVRFMFVGGGAGKAAVEARIAAGAKNLISLPYQPLEHIGTSLSAADVHAVTMGDDMVGIIHPCKIYGAMAVGRPIVFIGPKQSHVSEIIAASRCGFTFRHGDVTGTVDAIYALMSVTASERTTMGARASAFAIANHSRKQLLAHLCSVLEARTNKP